MAQINEDDDDEIIAAEMKKKQKLSFLFENCYNILLENNNFPAFVLVILFFLLRLCYSVLTFFTI